MNMVNIMYVIGAIGALALVYAVYATMQIRAFKVDHDRINELSEIIHSGAMVFLYREYKALVPFVVVVAGLLAWKIGIPSSVCFVSGALCSAFTGYIGMVVATRSNGKTAFAAMKGINGALKIAITGGSVMGMSVVGIGLLGVLAMFILFDDLQDFGSQKYKENTAQLIS